MIIHSSLDRLRQHSFVYYLLRDFGEHLAADYAKKAIIPGHFCRMMDGAWFLDNLEFEVLPSFPPLLNAEEEVVLF